MLADALAYMAIRYQDLYLRALPGTTNIQNHDSIETNKIKGFAEIWRQMLMQLEDVEIEPLYGGSLRICEQLCGEPQVHALAWPEGFDWGGATLKTQMAEICALALRLYHFQPALTTLHAVTSAQALAELCSLRPESSAWQKIAPKLWQGYWLWLTTLYLEKGFPLRWPEPSNEQLTQAENENWESLAAQARAIPEVHLIKMAYSCKWLYENLQADPLYKVAVQRMVEAQNAHPRPLGA